MLQTTTPKSYHLARLFLRGRAWGWYLSRLYKTEKRWNRQPTIDAPEVISDHFTSRREATQGIMRISQDDYSIEYANLSNIYPPRPRRSAYR